MDIGEFFRLATGEIPGPIRAGRISPLVQSALEAKTGVVWLSKDSIDKVFVKHSIARRGINPSAYYEHIEDTIFYGQPFRFHGNRIGLVRDLRDLDGRRFQVRIKVTTDQQELYLLNFHALRERDWRRMIRRYNPIANMTA